MILRKQNLYFAYYALSLALLVLIDPVKSFFGENNLPPLLPGVRFVINALYVNLALSFYLFVQSHRRELLSRNKWLVFLLVGAALCSLYPVFSGDLMEYLVRGRILGIYGKSPYQYVPADFPNDLLRPASTWAHNPDSYGPLFIWIETLPALVFRNSVWGMVWLEKMLFLMFVALSVYFFKKIMEVLGVAARTDLLILFALNPLYLVSSLVDGHNDVVMLAFTLAGVYALLSRRTSWVFICLTLAFLVKYTVLLILPALALWIVRDELQKNKKLPVRYFLTQAVLCGAIIVASFWPFWAGEKTFLALTRASVWFYTNTLPYAFKQALDLAGVSLPGEWVKKGALGLYAVAYIFILRGVWRAGADPKRFIRFLALIYLLFYLTITIPFGFHYLLWALPWLVLAEWPMNTFLVILYAFTGLFSYFKRMNYLIIIACGLYAIMIFLYRQKKRAKTQ